jgi:hypothetical protein
MVHKQTVHIIFKTHLDIGFTDLAQNVIKKYIDSYIPQAIDLAERLEAMGGHERFIWTTGAWMIQYYLEHASTEAKVKMENAIRKGHIVWHGLPFTHHTEVMNNKLFEYGLTIAQKLDATFDKKTIAAKMTDVPGHTIAMVPIMAAAGLKYLHIGTNPGSRAPNVPEVFLWKASDGSEIVVNYHDSYGAAVQIEGMSDILYFAHTSDNHGPQSVEDIQQMYRELSEKYPGASIEASTLDRFASKIWGVKSSLPIVREEIGDSWIHGVASDPGKVMRYRELLRLSDQWIAQDRLVEGSKEYEQFFGALIMVAEHTWGMDMKTFLPDFVNYSKKSFHAARKRDIIPTPLSHKIHEFLIEWSASAPDTEFSYSRVENSWIEQRRYVLQAMEALSTDKKAEAEEALQRLVPVKVEFTEIEPLSSFESVQLGLFNVKFGSEGAIVSLTDESGKVWADTSFPLGLYSYQTFGPADFHRWNEQYHTYWEANAHWLISDFGKPGMEFAQPYPTNRLFTPQLMSISLQRGKKIDTVIVKMSMPEAACEEQGAPREIWVEYVFRKTEPVIDVSISWYNKDAHRLPEASWFSFAPKVDNANLWRMDKLGTSISPLKVVRNGNRNLHAVDKGLYYEGSDGKVIIETMDAPVVSVGQPRLVQFENTFANLNGGMHFNLHNNVWGTNFRMWYEEDTKYRFSLTLANK